MPRLLSVCSEETPRRLKRRQLPLEIDDMRTMIAELEDPCSVVTSSSATSPPISMKAFQEKIASFRDGSEMFASLMISFDEFNAFLAQNVPCVGCRRSVEKTFMDVALGGYATLDPFYICYDSRGINHSILTMKKSYIADAKQLHRVLVSNYNRCRAVVDNLSKCKKNRRCHLHSIESQVCRNNICSSWRDVWNVMSAECREECCIVESDSLLDMLENYLQKHRFCPDCKGTLMRAYRCLVGETDVKKEKGYNEKLFEGLRYCSTEGHLHIKGCVSYLDSLVERAETELAGSSRERHAKTLEVGQLEVLTCIGLFMYGRLHRITNAIKSLQNSFQLFFCTATMAIYSNLQARLEDKNGLNESFERLCAELQTSAANPQRSSNGKSGKKKNKKIKNDRLAASRHSPTMEEEEEVEEATSESSPSTTMDDLILEKEVDCAEGQSVVDQPDAGYMSREGSPSGLSDPSPTCASAPQSNKQVYSSCDSCSGHARSRHSVPTVGKRTFPCCDATSLSDMLNDRMSPTAFTIAEEDINWFTVNQLVICEQRDALRKKIGEQFRALQTRLATTLD